MVIILQRRDSQLHKPASQELLQCTELTTHLVTFLQIRGLSITTLELLSFRESGGSMHQAVTQLLPESHLEGKA